MINRPALILTGPQGSGKSVFARWIAGKIGGYTEMPLHVAAKAGPWNGAPSVIIVDEADMNEKNLTDMKALVCDNPNVTFIFCSGDMNPLKLSNDNRRFLIVQMDGGAQ